MFGIDDFLIAAAVSGGSSFLSGLFGRKGAKDRAAEEVRRIEQANRANRDAADKMNREVRYRADRAAKVPIVTKQSTTANMDKMVADAIKNGFNPLTVLRSGGLAYYGNSTQTVTGSTAMDAALAGQHIATMQPLISQTQVPSMGEVFGKAMETMAGSVTSMMNSNQAQQFQVDLLGMQIAGANANSLYNHQLDRLFATPSAQISGSVYKTSDGGFGTWGGNSPNTVEAGGGWSGLVFGNDVFNDADTLRKRMRPDAASNSLAVYPWLMTDNDALQKIYGEGADPEGYLRAVRERYIPASDPYFDASIGPVMKGFGDLGQWYRDQIPSKGRQLVDYLTTGRWGLPAGRVYGGAR